MLFEKVAREGVEPTNNHEGLSFAALPVCVPRRLIRKASPIGFEPTTSCVTGKRALRCSTRTFDHEKVRALGFEPRLIGWKPIVLAVGHYTRMLSSSGGTRTHSISGSKPKWSANCLPSRSRNEWSTGESNPDLLLAKQTSSRWTSAPCVSCLKRSPSCCWFASSQSFLQYPEQGSNLQTLGFKPSRSADWRTWASSCK